MKLFKSKFTAKVICSCAMSLFSLLACFVGVVAWFQSVRNIKSATEGFEINGVSEITTINCHAIRYDGLKGAIATPITKNEKASVDMSEYDMVFTDRNVNSPLFVRIELINFNQSKDLQITIPCTGNFSSDGTTIDNVLSNVVSLKFAYGLYINNTLTPDTYDPDDEEDVKTIYTGMRDAMIQKETNEGDYGTPFVVDSDTKNNKITLSLNAEDIYREGFLIPTDQTEIDPISGNTMYVQKIVVYLEFNYCTNSTNNLVENYINSYSGAEHSNQFPSDIGSITLTDL